MEDREQELDQYINMDYVWILFGFCSNFKCLADHPVVAVFQVRLRRRFATFVAIRVGPPDDFLHRMMSFYRFPLIFY